MAPSGIGHQSGRAGAGPPHHRRSTARVGHHRRPPHAVRPLRASPPVGGHQGDGGHLRLVRPEAPHPVPLRPGERRLRRPAPRLEPPLLQPRVLGRLGLLTLRPPALTSLPTRDETVLLTRAVPSAAVAPMQPCQEEPPVNQDTLMRPEEKSRRYYSELDK